MARSVPPADPSGDTADSADSTEPAKLDYRRHLKPWQPGQSGNPHGRPIGVVRLIREQTKDFRTLVTRLVEIVEHGKDRDSIAAAQELFDRGGVSSKPLQLEISGPDGGPIQTVQQPYDLARLSPDQALRLRELLLAARRPVIEGEASEVWE